MMRFQTRDGEILKTIYANDGVLARRHLKALFWPDKSWRAMERRLAKLFHADYVSWPSREQHRHHPIPEPVCWLAWRGALYIAGGRGVKVAPPKGDNEYQLRGLQKNLRACGINWVREPRWSLLRHDLAVTDFRIAIEWSVANLSGFVLGNWLSESEFRSNTDVVTYTVKDRHGNVKRMKRGVCPDAYFEVWDEERRLQSKPHKARFLLELDMSTHATPRFGREKVAPGVAYIKSPAYKARFGNNSGYWLVVTNGGQRRAKNLMLKTRDHAGQGVELFFFTTFDDLTGKDPLTSPIWRQVGIGEPRALLNS